MTSASLTRAPSLALTDKQVFRLLFAATFVIFLASAAVERIVRLFRGDAAVPTKSIFVEAKETGLSTLLIAFTG